MQSQIKLGRIFGIRIGLHFSWLLIAGLIVISLAGEYRHSHRDWSGPMIGALAAVTAVLFFASLLIHELSHSLVAKSQGLPVKEITLFALGGVSQIEREAATAKTEFWMAFVGPLTSAVLGSICLLGVKIAGAGSGAMSTMFSWLGYINMALAGFNLIPGFPLDGGRVLRA
ncbi:MAG: site-2 protease family protein, partial [Acidobacteriia bacterium]|nr:site-2 protease family protein [Terriglobia bacterium]